MHDLYLIYYITSSAPTNVPANITYQIVNDTTLAYTWEMPLCGSRGGEITKYEYAFGIDGGQITDGWTSPENRVVSFDGLDYFKDYTFKIRATTAAGSGPYSDVIIVTTPESSKFAVKGW